MSVTIFGPDGSKRVLTDEESEEWRRTHEPTMAEKLAITQAWLLKLDEEKRIKRFAKRMEKRGYIQPRTRSSLGWRLRERPSSAIRFEELNPAIPNIDWDYAPVGEGTMWRHSPRTKAGNTEEITVWAVHTSNKHLKRQLFTARTYYVACEDAKCHKHTCALCWAVENAQIGAHEKIVLERIPIKNISVRDPSGIAPSGNKPKGPLVPGDEERSMYSLVSTQREYKKGSGSGW